MGMRGTQEDGPRQAVEMQVVDIGAAAGDEARILAPTRGIADDRFAHPQTVAWRIVTGKPGLRNAPLSCQTAGMTHYEAIVIGAGVAGIYQIKRLADLGIEATVLEAGGDLGGTWYWNRYPGARFDSESYTYGYSFSRELLDEWHWKERFSGQPENLRYLNHVADKFDLRKYMQFNCRVDAAHYDEAQNLWRAAACSDGRELTCRFLILALGLLSMPTLPRVEGMESFKGRSFHTFHWPHEPVDWRASGSP